MAQLIQCPNCEACFAANDANNSCIGCGVRLYLAGEVRAGHGWYYDGATWLPTSL